MSLRLKSDSGNPVGVILILRFGKGIFARREEWHTDLAWPCGPDDEEKVILSRACRRSIDLTYI